MHVTYCVSESKRTTLYYLVDSEKYPDRKLDVWGADNHKIASSPLVTTGGVTSTTSCEVIVIIHQYSHHGKNKTIQNTAKMKLTINPLK